MLVWNERTAKSKAAVKSDYSGWEQMVCGCMGQWSLQLELAAAKQNLIISKIKTEHACVNVGLRQSVNRMVTRARH